MAKTDSEKSPKFPTIQQCESKSREDQTVVADMDGTLFVGRSSFPYFALVAFEVGGISRLLFLVLASPLAGILYYFISESAGIQVLIFTTFAGMKVSDIESVARAVLPKFYSTDLHQTWRVFSSCGKRCVLTANPRIMVEPFLKEYLSVDMVIGTEICTYKGRATGFVNEPGILVGKNKAKALQNAFGSKSAPHIGLGDRKTDFPFMNLCKAKDRLEMSMVTDSESGESIESEVRTSSGAFLHKAQDEVVANVEARIAAWTFLPEVKPRKGDALLFFSLHLNATTDPSSLHGSCPVIEGEK